MRCREYLVTASCHFSAAAALTWDRSRRSAAAALNKVGPSRLHITTYAEQQQVAVLSQLIHRTAGALLDLSPPHEQYHYAKCHVRPGNYARLNVSRQSPLTAINDAEDRAAAFTAFCGEVQDPDSVQFTAYAMRVPPRRAAHDA